MEYLTVIKALQTIVEAHAVDIKFSTVVGSVWDPEETAPMLFTMEPMSGEEIVENNVSYDVYAVNCIISQTMDNQKEGTEERDKSLSMLNREMRNIFREFKGRHITDSTTINGEDLSCELETPPTYEVYYEDGINDRNALQCKFIIKDYYPQECNDTLFSY